MRVLITTDTLGGVWNYSIDLTEGLLAAGVEVYLISVGHKPDSHQARAISEVRVTHPASLRFTAIECPLEWMPGGTRLAESTTALEALINDYLPDLLHFNQYCYGAVNSKLPKLVVAHSDVVSWWLECLEVAPPADTWLHAYIQAVSIGLASADCVVAPTKWQLKQLETHYGYPEATGLVIANGAREDKITAPRLLQAVCAGRMWDQAKNIGVLEEANLDIPVYVAGSDHLMSERMSSVVTACNVERLGQLTHVALQRLFAESTLYIGPSLYEPFGLAPLEAARQGCALLLSDIGSFREIWQDDAVYFSPRNPEELRAQARILLADPALLREMARRGQRRALELYSLDAFISKYLSLYESMLNTAGIRNAA